MRQSNFNDISARVARGTLFLTAISMLSLHAMAQASDGQKPLPSPLFAVPTVAAVAPLDTAQSPSQSAGQPPATSAVTAQASNNSTSAPTANRVSGFAAPADTANAPAQTPAQAPGQTPAVITAAKPTVKPVAQAAAGATSRAGIRRLNQAMASPVVAQHPLADAYPGYEVIVCLAGCGSEPKAVSIYKPKLRRDDYAGMNDSTNSGFIRVAMTNAPEAVECLAGCYDNTPTRSHVIEPSKVQAAVPSAGSPVGATDRSVMIQTSTGMAANGVLKPKPKAAKKHGSEWFTRRFERKAS
jgi:hypothetical protein